MARRLDWEQARRRRKPRAAKKRDDQVKAVHPNSAAARVWGRTTWRSSL